MKSQWTSISSSLGLVCSECENAAQLARVSVIDEHKSEITGLRCNGHGEPRIDYLRGVWEEKMEPYTVKRQYMM